MSWFEVDVSCNAARSSCQVRARVVAAGDLRVQGVLNTQVLLAPGLGAAAGLLQRGVMPFSNIWARVDVGTIRGTWPANWLFVSFSLT